MYLNYLNFARGKRNQSATKLVSKDFLTKSFLLYTVTCRVAGSYIVLSQLVSFCNLLMYFLNVELISKIIWKNVYFEIGYVFIMFFKNNFQNRMEYIWRVSKYILKLYFKFKIYISSLWKHIIMLSYSLKPYKYTEQHYYLRKTVYTVNWVYVVFFFLLESILIIVCL